MRSSKAFQEISTELLTRGHSMRFHAEGGSMHPTIRDGEVIAVEFVEPRDVKRGDILLYRHAKRVLAHRVVAILNPRSSILNPRSSILNPPSSILYPQSSIFNPRSSILDPLSSILYLLSILHPRSSSLSPQYSFILRGDASSICDAPVESGHVLGRVVSVERDGRKIAVNSTIAKVTHYLRACAFRVARLRGIKPIFHLIRRLLVPVVVRSG